MDWEFHCNLRQSCCNLYQPLMHVDLAIYRSLDAVPLVLAAPFFVILKDLQKKGISCHSQTQAVFSNRTSRVATIHRVTQWKAESDAVKEI